MIEEVPVEDDVAGTEPCVEDRRLERDHGDGDRPEAREGVQPRVGGRADQVREQPAAAGNERQDPDPERERREVLGVIAARSRRDQRPVDRVAVHPEDRVQPPGEREHDRGGGKERIDVGEHAVAVESGSRRCDCVGAEGAAWDRPSS